MAEDRNEENQNQNQNGDHGISEGLANVSFGNGDSELNTIVQACAQEYENIDHTLDEIDGWMTKLEQQNDSLFAELDDLLESSRQTRKELQQQKEEQEEEPVTQASDVEENRESQQK